MRSLILVAAAVVCLAAPAFAGQNKPPARFAPKNPKAPKLTPEDVVKQLRAFQAMSKEEREKELAKLPPQRRAHVENQLARFDKMPPEERERQFHRLELMNTLTFERRGAVQDEIQRLRQLRPRFAREYLYSDEFKKKFSPVEQELIHGVFPRM